MPFDWKKFDREPELKGSAPKQAPLIMPTHMFMEIFPGDKTERKDTSSLRVDARRLVDGKYTYSFAYRSFETEGDVLKFIEFIGKTIEFVVVTCSNGDPIRMRQHVGQPITQTSVPFKHPFFPKNEGTIVVFYKFDFED